MIAIRVRQLAGEAAQLQEERLSWAAQAPIVRQVGAFATTRHRGVRPFEADRAAASHALCSSSMPLLQELPGTRPASAQPRPVATLRAAAWQHRRKAGAARAPPSPLGELGLTVGAASPALLPGSLRAAAAHSGLRSVHALHTQLLYTRSPALTRAAAATAASVARPLSLLALTSAHARPDAGAPSRDPDASAPTADATQSGAAERLQARVAEGQLLSVREVQTPRNAVEDDGADLVAAAAASVATVGEHAGEAEPLVELESAALARERLREAP